MVRAARPEAPPLAVLALRAAPFLRFARRPAGLLSPRPLPLPGTWRRRGRGSGSRGDAGADAGSQGGAARAGALSAGRPFVVGGGGDQPASARQRSRWSRGSNPHAAGCYGRRPAPSNLRQRSCPDLPGRCRVTREPWLASGLRADGTPVSPGNNPGSRTRGVFAKVSWCFLSRALEMVEEAIR